MSLFATSFKKSVSVMLVIIFTLSNIHIQNAYSLEVGRNNISPQSIFLPFDNDRQMKDLAMLEYVMHTAIRSEKVDLLAETNDRTALSMGVNFGDRENVRINFQFKQAQPVQIADTLFRLVPCSMNVKGRSEKYWCSVISPAGPEETKYVFLRDDEKSREDFIYKMLDLKHAERVEKEAIRNALESEKEQDAKIRRAIEKGHSEIIDYENYELPLSFITAFLGIISNDLTEDFESLVRAGQLRIITEEDEEFKLREPHAGGQGIYLPNDPTYINAGFIVHEIFAKAGFGHEENEVFRSMFDRFVRAYLDEKLDAPGELPNEMDLFGEEMRLVLEAKAAKFWKWTDEYERSDRADLLFDKTDMGADEIELLDQANRRDEGFINDMSTVTSTRDYKMSRDKVWRSVLPEHMGNRAENAALSAGLSQALGTDKMSFIEIFGRRDQNLRSIGDKSPEIKNVVSLHWNENVSKRDIENIDKMLRTAGISIKIAEDAVKELPYAGGGIGWDAGKRRLLVSPNLDLIDFYVLLSDAVEYVIAGENAKSNDREMVDDLLKMSRAVLMASKRAEKGVTAEFIEQSVDIIETGALDVGLRSLIAAIQMAPDGEKWLDENQVGKYSIFFGDAQREKTLTRIASSRAFELIAATDEKIEIRSRKNLVAEVLGATGYTYIGRGSKQMCFSVDQNGRSDKVIKVFLTEHGDNHKLVDIESEMRGVGVANKYLGGLIAALDYFENVEFDKMRFPSMMLLSYLQDTRSFNYDKITFPMVTVEMKVLPLMYSTMYDGNHLESPKVDTFVKDMVEKLEMELEASNGYIMFDTSPEVQRFKNIVDEYCRSFEEIAKRGVLHTDHKMSNCGITESGNIVVLDTDCMVVNEEDPSDFDTLLRELYGSDGELRLNLLFDDIRKNGLFFLLNLRRDLYAYLDEQFGEEAGPRKVIMEEQLLHPLEAYFQRKFRATFNATNVKKIWGTKLGERQRSLSPGEVDNNLEVALTRMLSDRGEESSEINEMNRFLRAEILQKTNFRIEQILSEGKRRRDHEVKLLRAKAMEAEQKNINIAKRLWDEAPIAFHIVDSTGNITGVNKKWCEIMGYTKEEVVGTPIFDHIIPEQRGNAVDRFMSRIYGGKEGHLPEQLGERQYVTKAGNKIYVKTENTILRDGDGNITGVDTSFVDITEQEKAREELAKSQQIVMNMNEACAVHKVVKDEDGKVVDYIYTYVNDAFEKMTGLDRENVIGRRVTEVLPGIENDPNDFIGQFGEVATTGVHKKMTCFTGHPQLGKWYDISVSSFEPDTFVAIFNDVSSQKRTESFQKFLAEVNVMFLQYGDQLELGIDRAIRGFGELVGADRTYVFQYTGADKNVLDGIYEWCSEGITPVKKDLRGIQADTAFPWAVETLKKNIPVNISSISDIPDEGIALRREMEREETRSVLLIPLLEGHDVFGFIGLDSVAMEREWTSEEINYATILGENIVNAMMRARAQEEIKKSEEHYKDLFYRLPVPVIIHNDNNRITGVNEAARKLFGYPGNELQGMALNTIDAEEFAVDRVARASEQKRQGYWSGLGMYKSKNGRVFNADVLTQKIGKSTIAVVQDTTERDFKIKTEALNGIVHDWRNATFGMNDALSQMVGDMEDSFPRGKAFIEWDQLRGLIASFMQGQELVESAMEAVKGTDVLVKQHIQVYDFARRIEDVFKFRIVKNDSEIGENKSRYLMFNSESSDRIFVDEKSLNMVLENLIKNARESCVKKENMWVEFNNKLLTESDFDEKYSRYIVQKQGERHFKPGDRVVEIVVADEGPGMSETVQKMIGSTGFTTKGARGGSGFGMQSVLERVKRLGGDLELITKQGEGSRFIVRFPLSPEDATNDIYVPGEKDVKQLKAIVVDDNPSARKVLIANLKNGFGLSDEQITVPKTYQELIGILAGNDSFDIAIFDQNLDGTNSFGAPRDAAGTSVIEEYKDKAVFGDKTTFMVSSSTANPRDFEEIKRMQLPFVEKGDGVVSFSIVLSEAFFEKNPGLKDSAQAVDLYGKIKDPMRAFLRGVSPTELINEQAGATPLFYTMASRRLHFLNNFLGGFIGFFEIVETQSPLLRSRMDPAGAIDAKVTAAAGSIARIIDLMLYSGSGSPRNKALDIPFEERLLLVAYECIFTSKVLDEMSTWLTNYLKHPIADTPMLDMLIMMRDRPLSKIGVSEEMEGLALSDILTIIKGAYRDTDLLDKFKSLKDEDIQKMKAVKDGLITSEGVKAAIGYLENGEMIDGSRREAKPKVKQKADETSKPSTKGAAVKMLVADDSDAILNIVRRFSEAYGSKKLGWNLTVDSAETAEEAKALIEKNGVDYYDAVVLDNAYKDKGGVLTGARLVRMLSEDMGFNLEERELLIMSGQPIDGVDDVISGQMMKPFTLDEFNSAILSKVEDRLIARGADSKAEEADAEAVPDYLEEDIARFKAMFDDADVAIVCLDEQGKAVYSNDLFGTLVGEGKYDLNDIVPAVSGVRKSKIGAVEVHSIRISLGPKFSMVQIKEGAEKKEVLKAKGKQVSGTENPLETTDKNKPRIIYVEDDPLIRLTVSADLESMGYSVTLAWNAQEGFDIMQKAYMEDNVFELAIFDVDLPEVPGSDLKNGISLVVRVRDAGYDLPIILYTSREETEIRINALMEKGKIDGVVGKTDTKTLFASVEHLLAKNGSRQGLAAEMQMISRDNTALVYGNFSEGKALLKKRGFAGEILHAEDKEDLRRKQYVRNINEFSVIINTTSDDLKVIITELLEEVLGILASSETKVDIVTLEDVERDPETFQTRLYQRCL